MALTEYSKKKTKIENIKIILTTIFITISDIHEIKLKTVSVSF